MRRALVVMAVALAGSANAAAQGVCAKAPTGASTSFFIEPVQATPRDTVLVARLCLVSAKTLGSYMATLTYDSTRMRVVSVTTAGGMQAANSTVAGIVRIAGAAPGGYANGVLATLSFKPVAAKSLDRIKLAVPEANTTASVSLLSEVRATGWPAMSPGATKPSVDSITPRAAEVGHERVTDIVLYGRGFSAEGNTVVFGDADVTGLASENGGTVIRFAAPTMIPAKGTASPRRIEPGPIDVRVRHSGGTSNAVRFLVKEDS